MRHTATAVACAALCGSAALNQDAGGGVVALSRTSSVSVFGFVVDESFEDTRSTDQFGVFEDVAAGAAGDTAGTHAHAQATQRSEVDISVLNFLSGSSSHRVDAFAALADPDNVEGTVEVQGDSHLGVEFRVTEPGAPFLVSGRFDGVPGAFDVSLFEISIPGEPNLVFSVSSDPQPDEFERMGFLEVGTYGFGAGLLGGTSASSPGDREGPATFFALDITFEFGSEAAPIPLPPAVWTGASGLIIAAGAMARTHRRRRA